MTGSWTETLLSSYKKGTQNRVRVVSLLCLNTSAVYVHKFYCACFVSEIIVVFVKFPIFSYSDNRESSQRINDQQRVRVHNVCTVHLHICIIYAHKLNCNFFFTVAMIKTEY